MLKKIFALLILFLVSVPSYAANHYIRAGASGANNGSDWTNAWTTLGAVTWTRGDVYYISSGIYSSITFGTANSGTTVIELRGAIGGAGDHGTNTGWNDSFQGQASIGGSVIDTNYWKINGQAVPGCVYPTDQSSCQLIKFSTSSTADGSSALRMDNTNVGVTLDYIDVQGSNVHLDGSHDEGVYCAPGPCTPLYLGHSHVHNTGCDTLSFNWGTGGSAVFEYDWIAYNNFGPTTAAHCQGIQSTIGTMTWRYSVFQDIQSSGAITLAAGGSGAPIVDWEIYGNIFFWDATWTASVSGDGRVGYDDGIVGIFDETQGCCSTAPLKIYNNTIYGLGLANSQNCNGQLYTINANEFVLFTGYNNLYANFKNSCNAGSAGAGTYDYNSYYQIANGTHDGGAHSTTSASAAPLSNPTASTLAGFQLTADTSAGLALAAPYNTDSYGTTRGTNGTWDRGFFQIAGAPSPGVGFSPVSVSFPNQNVLTSSSPIPITLTNTGGANLSISSISITGTNSGDFGQSNTCGATLGAGLNCTINVTFTPSVVAARSASVSVSDNAAGSPHTVPLSGTGVSITPPAAHHPVIMGSLPPGTVGVPYSAKLSVTGDTPPDVWTANPTAPGLTLAASTGVLAGTPTTSGAFSLTFTLTDSFQCSAFQKIIHWFSATSGCTNAADPYTTTLTVNVAPPLPPTCSTVAVNCRIKVTSTANIRQAPTSSTILPALLGTEPTGALGTVLAISPFGYAPFGVPNWVQVKFDSCSTSIPNCTGWMGSDNMTVVTTPPPPPAQSMTTTCAWLADGITWQCNSKTTNIPKGQAIKSVVTSGSLTNTVTGTHP